MNPTLLFSYFLFVMAAVAVAGYVFVVRPARAEAGSALPSALTYPQEGVSRAQAAVADALRLIGEAVPGKKDSNRLRSQLAAAGFRWPAAVSIYQGIKTAVGLFGALLNAWFSILSQPDIVVVLIAAAGGFGLGFMICDKVLQQLVSARMAKLRRALPAALDLLVLAIEAGQGLDAAILETSRGIRVTHPDLASEFTQLQLELRANASRAEALQNFAERSRDSELRKFANLLIDTDRFGGSLGPALKAHSRYLRIRFRQVAQEKGRKVGVKLIFPVFFLIFPSVILVTLGPAVILLTTQMKSMFI